MSETFNYYIELCKKNKLEEAEKLYFANRDLILSYENDNENLDNENFLTDFYKKHNFEAEYKKYINNQSKKMVEDFVKLCKNNKLKEAKKLFFANKNLINEYENTTGEIEELMYEHINDFINNKNHNIVKFIFDIKMCNLNVYFRCLIDDSNLELANINILKISNVNICDIWKMVKNIICSFFKLQEAKIIFEVMPEIFLKINENHDYILRKICLSKNFSYDKRNNEHEILFDIVPDNLNERLQMIQWILEEIKPDYDIIAIETIKNKIAFNSSNYDILIYLNGYIKKREKIILQEMINKCIIDNYIIFATATNK